MKLFHMIIKLIQMLHLAPIEEINQLRVDVIDWEEKASLPKATKMQKMYHKLHQGIYFRLGSPFLFVYLKTWVDGMLNGKKDDDFDDLD